MKKLITVILFTFCFIQFLNAQTIWVETESFANKGGWTVDGQFFDQMGSAYLLAHGVGTPVQDATTTVVVKTKGKYDVWVRTFNWNAPWDAKQAPGIFQLLINGKQVGGTLGNSPERWGWVKAGETEIQSSEITLTLRDLTGFVGRCDAIVLTRDSNLSLPDGGAQLAAVRKELTKAKEPQFAGDYDLVVVGGGVAGLCASISAARLGLKTALVHNRPVVGGNNSPEINVIILGGFNLPPYDAIGNVIAEMGNAFTNQEKILSILKKEENLTLFLNQHASGVEKDGDKIKTITATNLSTNETIKLAARLFADCTGDGNIGFMAGADFLMGRELRSEYNEALAPEIPSNLGYGSTLKWGSTDMKTPQKFPVLPWSVQFSENTVQYAKQHNWDWETGFRYNQIDDFEYIRDYALRVIYGNWSFIQNFSKNKAEYENLALKNVSYVPGKRESRRLLGDVIITQNDVEGEWKKFDDGCVKATYSIDQHFPQPENSLYFPGEEFRSVQKHNYKPLGVSIHNIDQKEVNEPYMIPYRCLFSRNVSNLFMAGRNVSATRLAMTSLRVQATTGMMGEVVGIAAFLSVSNDCSPREIYQKHLPEFKVALKNGVPQRNPPVFLPRLH
jgi:hypothetical protein